VEKLVGRLAGIFAAWPSLSPVLTLWLIACVAEQRTRRSHQEVLGASVSQSCADHKRFHRPGGISCVIASAVAFYFLRIG